MNRGGAKTHPGTGLLLNQEAGPGQDLTVVGPPPPRSLQVRLMQESVRRIIEAEESRMGEEAWPLLGQGGRWGLLWSGSARGAQPRPPPLLRLRRSSGLIIVNAWYGKFVNDKSRKSEKVKVIDVTVPLQCLVKDSKLILTEASKVPLGFKPERPAGGGAAWCPEQPFRCSRTTRRGRRLCDPLPDAPVTFAPQLLTLCVPLGRDFLSTHCVPGRAANKTCILSPWSLRSPYSALF